MLARSILITNYHPFATAALIRDFNRIGFKTYSPSSDWGRIAYFSGNEDLGSTLISADEYAQLPPGFVMITCKAQEEDLKAIGREHGDSFVLNIAQQRHTYESGISEVMICPDITTYESYPGKLEHKMLYFPKPVLSTGLTKDIDRSFFSKQIASYISLPHIWKEGYSAFKEFKDQYSDACYLFGFESPDGPLSHDECNRTMMESFFTVHFKEDEAYGLSCLESMLLGTPVVSLKRFMHDKTLGRYFLNPDNSIVTDTIGEAIAQLRDISLEQYRAMSIAATQTVSDLTSDNRTISRLRVAMDDVIQRNNTGSTLP